MKPYVMLVSCLLPLAAYAGSADSSFYKDAAEAGIAEVDDATLAQQSATDPKLKDFAAMMIKDHTEANSSLAALAGSKNVSLPKSASMTQMAGHAKLKLESGDSFDKSYIKAEIEAHRDTIKLLRKEMTSGEDADAKAFAKKILPTVEGHLKAIKILAATHGVSA